MDNNTNESAMEQEVTTQKLLEDLKVLVRDGEELLRAGADNLSEKGREVRAKLAAAMEAAKKSGYRLEERALASAKAADRTIREHPYQTVGIAFGVGLLIGVLINRK